MFDKKSPRSHGKGNRGFTVFPIVLLLAAVTSLGTVYAAAQLNDAPVQTETSKQLLSGGENKTEVQKSSAPVKTKEEESMPEDFYMLLLGVDSSKERRSEGDTDFTQKNGGGFRSDAIILMHANTKLGNITLLSFDRDIKSIITGHEDNGYCKLNAAYEFGGMDGMKQEIEELSGIKIPYVAAVDMDALRDVVDILGGVDVNIDEAFYDEWLDAGFEETGVQHIDGDQALVYSRSRHPFADGTVTRTHHQRQIIAAIFEKLRTSDLTGIYSVLSATASNVATNLTWGQLYELGTELKKFKGELKVTALQSPTNGCLDGEIWFGFPIQNEWYNTIALLRANDGREEPSESQVRAAKRTVDASTTVWSEDSGYEFNE